MVPSRDQYGPRSERTDALLQRSRRVHSRIGLSNPIARFIKHVKLRLFQRYIESDIVGHRCSIRMLVLRRLKLYPSRTTHPSSARAITAMFRFGLQVRAIESV
jgi:hypothetical protein